MKNNLEMKLVTRCFYANMVAATMGKTNKTHSYIVVLFQTSIGLLGMLSSTVKCVHSYSTPDLKKYGPAALKQIRLVWISHKNVLILTGDNREFKYSV